MQENITFIDFGDHKVSVLGSVEDPWFIAREIGTVFDIKNIRQNLTTFPVEWHRLEKIQTNGGIQENKIISVYALKQLLYKTRKSVKIDFLNALREHFGISVDVINPCAERIWIEVIKQSFQHFDAEEQYKIGSYRTDLCFPKQKIIVECDEHGHRKYEAELERERARYLVREGYELVRFDPYQNDFNIGKVINQLIHKMHIKVVKEKPIVAPKPAPATKECGNCHLTLDASLYNKDRSKKDGLTTICKNCERLNKAKYKARQIEIKNSGEMAKTCSKCAEIKPLSDFVEHKYSKGGLTAQCRECVKDSRNARRQQQKSESVRFVCEICEKTYARRDTLATHVKKAHAEVLRIEISTPSQTTS